MNLLESFGVTAEQVREWELSGQITRELSPLEIFQDELCEYRLEIDNATSEDRGRGNLRQPPLKHEGGTRCDCEDVVDFFRNLERNVDLVELQQRGYDVSLL